MPPMMTPTASPFSGASSPLIATSRASSTRQRTTRLELPTSLSLYSESLTLGLLQATREPATISSVVDFRRSAIRILVDPGNTISSSGSGGGHQFIAATAIYFSQATRATHNFTSGTLPASHTIT